MLKIQNFLALLHPLNASLSKALALSLCCGVVVTSSVVFASGPDGATSEPAAVEEAPGPAETWGLEIVAIRVTAAGHMLDFRYKVHDVEKAAPLFNSETKPYLIHQASGKVLSVPVTAKLGPMRSKYIPRAERIYSMLFTNAGIVKAGDRVDWVLGDLRVDDLLVE